MGVTSADTYYRLDNSVENGATQDETVTATVSGNSIIFQLTPTQVSDGWFDHVGFPTDVKFAGMMTPNGGIASVYENMYINNIGYFNVISNMVSSRPITQVTVFFNGNLPPSPIFYAKVSWSKPVTGQSFTSSIFTNIPKPKEKITPIITWNTPADIISGTSLGPEQLNAIATDPNTGNSVTGTFTYNPEEEIVLDVGTHTLHVDFTPTDTTKYNLVSHDVTINVLKATPTVTWSTPADIIAGTALSSTQLNAVASVPGTFIYTPAEGTILSTGTQTLKVDFTPTDTANYATASQEVTINVLTPVQKIQQIITVVQSLNLNKGQSNALIVKLNAATKNINAGNTMAATNEINSFINQVNAFKGKQLLSTEAQPLIDAANSVINALKTS